jgi:hypothetical protein
VVLTLRGKFDPNYIKWPRASVTCS